MALSAGATEYTDCICADAYDPANESTRYDTKRSQGEVPVMQKLWEDVEYPFTVIAPWSSLKLWVQ